MNLTTQVTGFGHTTIKADTEEMIITVSGGSSLQSHIDMVNKILAAPDLLEACEALLKMPPTLEAVEKAKAAIIKAKGQ